MAEDIIKYVDQWNDFYKRTGENPDRKMKDKMKDKLIKLTKLKNDAEIVKGALNKYPTLIELIKDHLNEQGAPILERLEGATGELRKAVDDVTESNKKFEKAMKKRKGQGNEGDELEELNVAITQKTKAWENLLTSLVPFVPGRIMIGVVAKMVAGTKKAGINALASLNNLYLNAVDTYHSVNLQQIERLRGQSGRVLDAQRHAQREAIKQKQAKLDASKVLEKRTRAEEAAAAAEAAEAARRKRHRAGVQGGSRRRKKSSRKTRNKRKTIRRKVVRKSIRKKSLRKTKKNKRKTKRMRR